MKSIERRLADLREAVEAATTRERIIELQLLVVEDRRENALLDALEEREPDIARPAGRGRVRLRIIPSVTAKEHLAAHGTTLSTPPEEPN